MILMFKENDFGCLKLYEKMIWVFFLRKKFECFKWEMSLDKAIIDKMIFSSFLRKSLK